MFDGKTYWLIGASEGLGRELASALSQQGARLILSARSAGKLAQLADDLPDARALAMDVTDPASVAAAAREAGPVDGIIYCAGAYEPMAAPDWDAAALQLMNEVNYLGAVRVLGHVVPQFARRRAGHIVLIGSLAGFRGLPRAVGYSSSKAALMALGETLYADLSALHVKVQVVSPGFIATRLTAKNSFDMPQIMTPEAAAEKVLSAMRGPRLHTAFPRPFSLLFTLGSMLPARLFLRLFPRNRATTHAQTPVQEKG